MDPHTRVRWEATGEGRSRPEDGGVSGRPDAVHPEGSFSFKPRSLALIPGMSFRFRRATGSSTKTATFLQPKRAQTPANMDRKSRGPREKQDFRPSPHRTLDNKHDSEAGLPLPFLLGPHLPRAGSVSLLVKGSRTPLGRGGEQRTPEPQAQAGPLAEEAFPRLNAGRGLSAPGTVEQSHTRQGLVWFGMQCIFKHSETPGQGSRTRSPRVGLTAHVATSASAAAPRGGRGQRASAVCASGSEGL